MTLERTRLVGAVLDAQHAAGAARELLEEGIADDQLLTAVWQEEGFAIDPSADRRMGTGLVRGLAIGTVVGAVLGFLVLLVVPPSSSVVTDLLVGGIGGATAGAFFGAYLGLNRQRLRFWEQEDWEHVDTAPGEVLIVVDAGDRRDATLRILRRHGGRVVEPARPR